jgi:hypothetical protein
LSLISSCTDQTEAILEEALSGSRFNFLFSKNLAKELILVANSIFKFGDPQRNTLGGKIITYIRVEDVS